MTAAATLRRFAGRRRAAARGAAPLPQFAPAVPTAPAVAPAPSRPAPAADAVVLPFPRRPIAEPHRTRPTTPARCGDNGGRTKAGAPCAARATSGGRCHHHKLTA